MARRRMLELSSFGPEKGGPKNRRGGRANAMASISAEDTSAGYAGQASDKNEFPMTSFSASSGAQSRKKPNRSSN